MRNYIDSFLAYIKTEKMASPSTIYGYKKEVKKFIDYITNYTDILDINLISTSTVRQYFYYSKESRSLCQSSISKIIATVKSFFNYLEEEKIIVKNPTRKIKGSQKGMQDPFCNLKV